MTTYTRCVLPTRPHMRRSDRTTAQRVARRAFFAIWNRKSSINLVGNTINLQTGAWIAGIASTGAGIDSLYEYMLKSHVLCASPPASAIICYTTYRLADDEYFRVWDEANAAILRFIRSPEGFFVRHQPRVCMSSSLKNSTQYRGVNMNTGAAVSADIDSLGAYLSGLLVLSGDVDSAIRAHLVYANLWRRYSAMPETFNIARVEAVSPGYPLRPEVLHISLASSMQGLMMTRSLSKAPISCIERRTILSTCVSANASYTTSPIAPSSPAVSPRSNQSIPANTTTACIPSSSQRRSNMLGCFSTIRLNRKRTVVMQSGRRKGIC